MAGEKIAVLVSKDWNVEAKRLDARGDLLDLAIAVEPGIAGIEFELLDREMLNPKLGRRPRLARSAPHRPYSFARPRAVSPGTATAAARLLR